MYIFDLDGTITDTNGVWLDVDREFLARRGLPHTPEYQRVVERSIYPIAAQFTKAFYHLPESPEDIMAEWDASAGRHYRELAPLKPGAEEFLLQCRDEGRPMAVFTACRPALCRAALDRFHLTDLFDRIAFAEEIGLEKRNPRCFVELSRRLGVPPEACTLFDPYYADRQEELKAVCTRYIRSFAELVRG